MVTMVTYKRDTWKAFGPLGNDKGCLTFAKLSIIYKIKKNIHVITTHNITLLQ